MPVGKRFKIKSHNWLPDSFTNRVLNWMLNERRLLLSALL